MFADECALECVSTIIVLRPFPKLSIICSLSLSTYLPNAIYSLSYIAFSRILSTTESVDSIQWMLARIRRILQTSKTSRAYCLSLKAKRLINYLDGIWTMNTSRYFVQLIKFELKLKMIKK